MFTSPVRLVPANDPFQTLRAYEAAAAFSATAQAATHAAKTAVAQASQQAAEATATNVVALQREAAQHKTMEDLRQENAEKDEKIRVLLSQLQEKNLEIEKLTEASTLDGALKHVARAISTPRGPGAPAERRVITMRLLNCISPVGASTSRQRQLKSEFVGHVGGSDESSTADKRFINRLLYNDMGVIKNSLVAFAPEGRGMERWVAPSGMIAPLDTQATFGAITATPEGKRVVSVLTAMIETKNKRTVENRQKKCLEFGLVYHPSGRAAKGGAWGVDYVKEVVEKRERQRVLWVIVVLSIVLKMRYFRQAVFCQVTFLLSFVLHFAGLTDFGHRVITSLGLGVSRSAISAAASIAADNYESHFPTTYLNVILGSVAVGAVGAKVAFVLADNYVALAGSSSRSPKAFPNEPDKTNFQTTHTLSGLVVGPCDTTNHLLIPPSSRARKVARAFLLWGAILLTALWKLDELAPRLPQGASLSFTVIPLVCGSTWMPLHVYPIPRCSVQTRLRDYNPVPSIEGLSSKFMHYLELIVLRHIRLAAGWFILGHIILCMDTGKY